MPAGRRSVQLRRREGAQCLRLLEEGGPAKSLGSLLHPDSTLTRTPTAIITMTFRLFSAFPNRGGEERGQALASLLSSLQGSLVFSFSFLFRLPRNICKMGLSVATK